MEPEVPQHLTHNIETIAALRARAEGSIGTHQRAIERVTTFLGRPRTIYAIFGFAAAWVGYNLLAFTLGGKPFDRPPFPALQGLFSLAALLMTIMVLTTQNRIDRHAEKRAHLDLQVNLLAEQKIAKLIGLVEELRRDLPNVKNRSDAMAEAMTNAVDPTAVASMLEQTFEDPTAQASPPK
ncbi:MAG: DUF1003 domain-containing protein [Polyangiales bacterium]